MGLLGGVFLDPRRQLFFLLLRLLPDLPTASVRRRSASSSCPWPVRLRCPIACIAGLRSPLIPATGGGSASVPNPIVAPPASAPANGPGPPKAPTPTTSRALTTSNASASGVPEIPVTGSDLVAPKPPAGRNLRRPEPRNPLIRSRLQFRHLPLRYKISCPVRYKIPGVRFIHCWWAFWRSRWALRYKRTSSATATSWQLKDGRFSGMVPRVLPFPNE